MFAPVADPRHRTAAFLWIKMCKARPKERSHSHALPFNACLQAEHVPGRLGVGPVGRHVLCGLGVDPVGRHVHGRLGVDPVAGPFMFPWPWLSLDLYCAGYFWVQVKLCWPVLVGSLHWLVHEQHVWWSWTEREGLGEVRSIQVPQSLWSLHLLMSACPCRCARLPCPWCRCTLCRRSCMRECQWLQGLLVQSQSHIVGHVRHRTALGFRESRLVYCWDQGMVEPVQHSAAGQVYVRQRSRLGCCSESSACLTMTGALAPVCPKHSCLSVRASAWHRSGSGAEKGSWGATPRFRSVAGNRLGC